MAISVPGTFAWFLLQCAVVGCLAQPEGIEQFIVRLKDADPEVRYDALYRLDASIENAERAISTVTSLLGDSEDFVRIGAAAAYLRLGGDVDRIEALLADSDADVRMAACRLLLVDGRRVAPAVQTLIALSSADDNRFDNSDFEAESTFPELSSKLARDAVSPLLTIIGEAHSSQGPFHAFQALLSCDGLAHEHVPVLAKLLRHNSSEVRGYAAELLTWLGSDVAEAIPDLETALNDEDRRVRALAAAALLPFDAHRRNAQDVLREVLRGADENGHREALDGLIRHPQSAADLVPELVDTLGKRDRLAAQRAEQVLVRIGPTVLPRMIAEVESPTALLTHEYLWVGIAHVIRDLGPQASTAVSAVLLLSEFPGSDVQMAAAEALAAAGAGIDSAVSRIIELLLAIDPEVRKRAVEVLPGAVNQQDLAQRRAAEDSLRRRLEDTDGVVRVSAARSLLTLGVDSSVVLPVLDKLLKGQDGSAIRAAFDVYVLLGPKATASVDALIAAFESDAWFATGFHAYAIHDQAPGVVAALGPEAVPKLIAALQDKNPQVRAHAAEALGMIGPPAAAAAPHLVPLVSDETEYRESGGFVHYSRYLGEDAIEAVGRIGVVHGDVVPMLIEIARGHDAADNWLDQRPATAARALGGFGVHAGAALPVLWAIVDDDSRSDALYALGAIARIAPDDPRLLLAMERLLRQIERDDALGISQAYLDMLDVCATIEGLGHRALPLVPKLERLALESPLLDAGIRCSAARTLAVIDPQNQRGIDYLKRQVEIEKRGLFLSDYAERALEELKAAGRRLK